MNDSHPSGMPHVDGTPGLGQQLIPISQLPKFSQFEEYLLDVLGNIEHAFPANTPTVVNTLHTPATDLMYVQERATGLARPVLGLAVWSTGDVTPITWAEDEEGIVAIPPDLMHHWKLGTNE